AVRCADYFAQTRRGENKSGIAWDRKAGAVLRPGAGPQRYGDWPPGLSPRGPWPPRCGPSWHRFGRDPRVPESKTAAPEARDCRHQWKWDNVPRAVPHNPGETRNR